MASRFLLYVGRDSLILFGIQGLVANTYTYTGIPQFLATGWDGLMLYLANLAVRDDRERRRGVRVPLGPRPHRSALGRATTGAHRRHESDPADR